MFFIGAAFYLWRGHVRLSYGRFAALCAALALSSLNRHVFLATYMLTLGPIVLHLAYLFGGPVRAYNRLGDYSYGVYIYAFPIQQSLVALIPGLSLAAINLYACALSVTFAVLSWRLVEKPALGAKLKPAEATQRLFERLSPPWRMAPPAACRAPAEHSEIRGNDVGGLALASRPQSLYGEE